MAWSDQAREAAKRARRLKARPLTQETHDRYKRAMSYLHKKAEKYGTYTSSGWQGVKGKKGVWKRIHAKRNRLNTERAKIAGHLFDRSFTADMLLKGAMSKRKF